ncbi:undecaprenyldiphospho-muramoylpentapeptide beta-N-acetylglucosaminyltransferase [Synchytrium microbalum]|uniref:sterol 3beta-glucosyltransferase n=1 Tax=Synchytrium microbalum TaxID=1806994 RepID=A0A507C3X8_9FUNG|nr:undecaprenyldiphospho-muramoylpentapeptide beta-N-acetylglucosaminyltransferase [Synchytrium microbalum]TPX36240.1 undecaprenyldiphospho-muramoylpentapeptide beta-N-acetylglucosaminyltransferase [Synchytrium microbalum]
MNVDEGIPAPKQDVLPYDPVGPVVVGSNKNGVTNDDRYLDQELAYGNTIFTFARQALRLAELEEDEEGRRQESESEKTGSLDSNSTGRRHPTLNSLKDKIPDDFEARRKASFVSTKSALGRRALDSLARGSTTLSLMPVRRNTILDKPTTEAPLSDDEGEGDDSSVEDLEADNNVVSERIKVAFDLPVLEAFKGEFACWLSRSVLLKGYMFITTGHMCFYTSLPRDQSVVRKSGYLSKRSLSAPTYYTYWFVLKEDVLTFYANSTDIYFPFGSIDMKKVIDITTSASRKNGFKIETPARKYHLTADTDIAVQEWIHALQASMFRAKNEADDVRIVLPFANITDMQLNTTSAGVDSIRIRVSDDDVAEEAYYFTFFNDIRFAYDTLHTIWQEVHREIKTIRGKAKPVSTMYDSTASSSLPPKPESPTRDLRPPTPSSALSQSSPRPKSSNPFVALSAALPPSAITNGSLSPSNVLGKIPRVFHRRSQSDMHASKTNSEASAAADLFNNVQSVTSPSADSVMSSSTSPSLSSSPDRERPNPLGSQTSLPLVSVDSPPPGTERPPSPQKHGSSSSWGSWATPFSAGHRKTPSDVGLQYLSDYSRDFGLTDKRREEFVRTFGLPESEELHGTALCYFERIIPRLGRMFISELHLCFNSNIIGPKMMIPLSDVVTVKKEKARMSGLLYHSILVKTKDQQEFIFAFHSSESCDLICQVLNPKIVGHVAAIEPEMRTAERRKSVELIRKQVSVLKDLQHDEHSKSSLTDEELNALPPVITEVARESPKPMHITCLTIGTRGDVQPYIALAKRLKGDGHTVRIATHLEYKGWIEDHGLEFGEVKGDPAALIALCVDNGMFSVSFMREGLSHFRGWFDELLISGYEACAGTELIIQSPTAFSGLHIAEAMQIPYFSAFPMPWTKTRAYPHPFSVPEIHMGGSYNYMTYSAIDTVMWMFMQYQVNAWRKKTLDRPPVGSLDLSEFPFLYSFSPSVVPHPPDWPDTTHICGYWFLDNPDLTWKAPQDLLDFLQGDTKPVYIGFGSIVVPDPDEMTTIIIEAVKKSGVKAILSKGWSARPVEGKVGSPTKGGEEVYPDCIYPVSSVPHDWLFPQLAGVVHHGGAGTAAAGLRAGVPTLIKPFFGDQFFWADRLTELGVGVSIRKLTVDKLAEALITITTDTKMAEKAKVLGAKIRREDGVGRAVEYIYRDLELSRRRIIKLHADVGHPSVSNNTTRPSTPIEGRPLSPANGSSEALPYVASPPSKRRSEDGSMPYSNGRGATVLPRNMDRSTKSRPSSWHTLPLPPA